MVLESLSLPLSAFLASLVEFVEAFTIVLAVGVSRGWRAALAGAGAAALGLAVLVAAFGPALLDRVDERVLLLVIGVLLLLFGARWLRKAMLRASGLAGRRDEQRAFGAELASLREHQAGGRGFDWAGFAVAGKGMFLEGVEVVFIVLSLGATGGGYLSPTVGAAAALAVVAASGAALRRPLQRVPENALKYAVGAMLVTFGVYWTAEGLGVAWAGGTAALGYLLGATLVASWVAVRALRRAAATSAAPTSAVAW